MAKYHGTYACGHEGTITLFGPTKDREWKIQKEFSGICPECYAKQQEELRAKKNQEAAEKSLEMELQELDGSPKQVAWANTLRIEFLDKYGKMVDAFRKDGKKEQTVKLPDSTLVITEDVLLSAREWILKNKTEAKFWIETRTNNLVTFIKEAMDKLNEEPIPEEVREEMEKEEESLIVTPESGADKGGIVKIYTGEQIRAVYEKDDLFREIVKELGYVWENGAWRKIISEFTGSSLDRVAELGNKLLNAGFTVRFPDRESMEKAVDATYEPECTRWIKKASDGKLAIHWRGRNDTLYQAARKLPGAKYFEGAIIVPVERYSEIEDFAETMEFKISKKAAAEIELFRQKEQKFIKVTPNRVQDASSDEERLKKQLEKSGVIEDLMDE